MPLVPASHDVDSVLNNAIGIPQVKTIGMGSNICDAIGTNVHVILGQKHHKWDH